MLRMWRSSRLGRGVVGGQSDFDVRVALRGRGEEDIVGGGCGGGLGEHR